MGRLLAILLLGLLSVPGWADDPKLQLQGWQQKAANEIPKVFRIAKKAYWVQDISLWIDVPPGKADWQTISHIVCGALDAMGRPPKTFVALSFIDSTSGKPEFVAKAYCEPRNEMAPSPDAGQVLKDLRG